MSFFAIYPAIAGSGGGGSGITSINGDTTTAQLIVGGTGISAVTAGGTTTITNTGSGSGTVTSVSVTTANGVSGSVATATTTPAISLTLGAITPSSVAAVGTVTGSNLSGTNTGDQTITLTGDVTGSGTGSFAATIAAGAVDNSKVANAAAIAVNKLAALTASRAVASDGSGFLTPSATTSAELGFVSGVTSAIQTQLNGKQASGNYITALTGDVTAAGPGSSAATLAATSNATLTTLSGLTTASSLASVGTVTSGTWNATTVAIAHGGTGQTSAGAAFGALSPLTTKGDIVGFDTVNNRVPIGSNGQVLTADSGQALGLKWATPTAANIIWTQHSSVAGAQPALTSADNRYQSYILSANASVNMPSAGILAGDQWTISSGNFAIFTVNGSDGSLIDQMIYGTLVMIAKINTPVVGTDWLVVDYINGVNDNWFTYTPGINAGITLDASSITRARKNGPNVDIYCDWKVTANTAAATPLIVEAPSFCSTAAANYPFGTNTGLGSGTFTQGSFIFDVVPCWSGVSGPPSSFVFFSGHGAAAYATAGGNAIAIINADQLVANSLFGFTASLIVDQFSAR